MTDDPAGPPSLASFVSGPSGNGGGGMSQGGNGSRGFDRVPPHSLEAEVSVLGAALLSRNAAAEVTEVLRADDFYRTAHAVVFEAISHLTAGADAVDAVTVLDWLTRNGRLDEVGGATALHELTASVPTAANAAHYARIVKEKALLRRLIEAGTTVARMGYEASEDAREVVDRAEAMIYEVAERGTVSDFAQLKELLNESFEAIEKLAENRSEVTGLATGFNDLDRLTAGLQPQNLILIAARPAMGKCAGGDSRITLSDGSSLPIRDAVERGRIGKPLSTLSLDGRLRLGETEPTGFHANGVRPTFAVRTRLGRRIRLTANHPLLTPAGWRELRELRPGDLVAVPRVLPFFGTDRMLDAEVKLLGYLLGDGSLIGTTPVLTTASFAIQEDAGRCAAPFGLTVSVAESPGGVVRALSFRSGRREADSTLPNRNFLTERLRDLGLWGCGSHDKFVPEPIFRAPRDQVALFLSRLFATDGSAWVAGKHGYFGISYCSVSERLIRDVQHLLLRFGVIARIREKQLKYLPDGPEGPVTRRLAYELEIRDADNVLRFLDEIGIFSKEDACERVRAAAEARGQRHTNTDLLPIEIWDLVLAEKGERSWADVSEATGRPRNHNWHVGKRRPSRRLVAELAQALDSEALRRWAHSDVYWDEIVSIEEYGPEPVYDLTVPELQNFVADDLIVHNSSLSLNLAQYVTVELTRPVIIFSLEMAKREIVTRLLASEARIDTHRIMTGRLEDADWRKLGDALGRLSEAPLFIDDTPSITLMEIRAKCRRLKQRHGLDLVIVDYLQLMQSHSARRPENRQQEVAEISRGLKMLAKELDVPVVALSQLSRQPENRTDKRPQLADLRESGCLTRDMRLMRADTGAPITFGELLDSGEDVEVWARGDDGRLQPGRITNVFESGVKRTYRVVMSSGLQVEASGNHPFLALDGWVALDDLAVGTRVATARRLPEPADPQPMDPDEIVLLAHLIGEGTVLARQPVHYTSADAANLDAVEKAAYTRFGITARRRPDGRSKVTTQLYLPAPYHLTHGRRNPIAAWLDDLGVWNRRSYEKRLPSAAFSLPIDQVRFFLHHLWATDGSIYVAAEGRSGPRVRIYYSTSSQQLARDLQLLLRRLDIRARISTPPSSGRPNHHVTITGAAQQRRFLRLVGCHGARGDLVEPALARLDGVASNPNVDVLPLEVWERVRARRVEVGMTEREFQAAIGTSYCGSTLYRSAPSRRRLARIAAVLDDPSLARLAADDMSWDEVVAIEPTGEQPVYDATVAGHHNFVCEGVVLHNSLEQDADIVAFIYRDEVYDEESPDRGIAELIVSKHRNGATGTVRLAFLNHLTKFANLARGTSRSGGGGGAAPPPPPRPPGGNGDTPV